MADLSIVAGATSQSINVDLYVLATGAAQTGLVFNSTSLTANYSFTGANATSVSITLATLAAVNSAYSSGGFKEIDSTGMPGLYRLDLPNAALATSKGREVVITVTGFSGMATRHIKIELTGVDNQDGVHFGITGIPNAAAGASGGLLISGSNAGTTTFGALTVTGATTCTGNVSMAAGLNITQSASNTSALVVTGNGTGSGAVFTSGSGATGDGLKAVAASTNGNGVTFTKTGSGSDLNATVTPLTLAKTTNITGFNDIAASAIVSSGAITTSGGAVSTVTTTTTATNLTNAPTAGDFTATMKTSLNASTPKVDGTSPLTESYAAQGAALTLAQALYGMNQFLGQHSTSGTTWTIKKRDGSTTAKTYTLDSSTAPTSISEAT